MQLSDAVGDAMRGVVAAKGVGQLKVVFYGAKRRYAMGGGLGFPAPCVVAVAGVGQEKGGFGRTKNALGVGVGLSGQAWQGYSIGRRFLQWE